MITNHDTILAIRRNSFFVFELFNTPLFFPPYESPLRDVACWWLFVS